MGLLEVLGLPRPTRAIEPAASPKLTPSAATVTGQPVRRNDTPTVTTGTPTGATTGTPPPVNTGGGTTAPTQEEINYEAERKAVQALADALRGHQQAARI